MRRAWWVALVAVAGGALAHATHGGGAASDLTPVLVTARQWWDTGVDPYTLVGPGRPIDSVWGLQYPFAALLAVLPLTWTPWPDGLFVALSLGMWGWAVRDRPGAWWGLATFAGLYVVRMSQWEGLLTGAAVLGWPAAVWVCKPHVGAALVAGYPSRGALYGGLGLLLLSVVLLPSWPGAWWQVIQSSPWHFRAPVQEWGGPLILLALWEWRRPEARLLVALACVPQTPQLYSVFPLFLVPQTGQQGAVLAAGVWAVVLAVGEPVPFHALVARTAPLITLFAYLPCLGMVLWPRVRAWRQVGSPVASG